MDHCSTAHTALLTAGGTNQEVTLNKWQKSYKGVADLKRDYRIGYNVFVQNKEYEENCDLQIR